MPGDESDTDDLSEFLVEIGEDPGPPKSTPSAESLALLKRGIDEDSNSIVSKPPDEREAAKKERIGDIVKQIGKLERELGRLSVQETFSPILSDTRNKNNADKLEARQTLTELKKRLEILKKSGGGTRRNRRRTKKQRRRKMTQRKRRS